MSEPKRAFEAAIQLLRDYAKDLKTNPASAGTASAWELAEKLEQSAALLEAGARVTSSDLIAAEDGIATMAVRRMLDALPESPEEEA